MQKKKKKKKESTPGTGKSFMARPLNLPPSQLSAKWASFGFAALAL